MYVSRTVWCTQSTQELQIFDGKSGYRNTIGPGDKTGESLHYTKEQLLNIRRVMCESRRFKTMTPETIRRVCKYRLNKREKRSGEKTKHNKKVINHGNLIEIKDTSTKKVSHSKNLNIALLNCQ